MTVPQIVQEVWHGNLTRKVFSANYTSSELHSNLVVTIYLNCTEYVVLRMPHGYFDVVQNCINPPFLTKYRKTTFTSPLPFCHGKNRPDCCSSQQDLDVFRRNASLTSEHGDGVRKQSTTGTPVLWSTAPSPNALISARSIKDT